MKENVEERKNRKRCKVMEEKKDGDGKMEFNYEYKSKQKIRGVIIIM
jgi:hypothetical protein